MKPEGNLTADQTRLVNAIGLLNYTHGEVEDGPRSQDVVAESGTQVPCMSHIVASGGGLNPPGATEAVFRG